MILGGFSANICLLLGFVPGLSHGHKKKQVLNLVGPPYLQKHGIFGGFLKWRYPNSWMLYKGKSYENG